MCVCVCLSVCVASVCDREVRERRVCVCACLRLWPCVRSLSGRAVCRRKTPRPSHPPPRVGTSGTRPQISRTPSTRMRQGSAIGRCVCACAYASVCVCDPVCGPRLCERRCARACVCPSDTCACDRETRAGSACARVRVDCPRLWPLHLPTTPSFVHAETVLSRLSCFPQSASLLMPYRQYGALPGTHTVPTF